MSKKKILICVLLSIVFVFLFLLSACSAFSNSSPTQDLSVRNSSYVCIDDIKDAETIEETKYYKIIQSGFVYYYFIFDKNNDTVKADGPLNRLPRISMVNDHLVRFTLQAGTGIGTQWGYYYDTKADAFSQVFQSIYDQSNNKVVYGDVKKIIVRDIFDKAAYYQEISTFTKPLSEVAEPITNVAFVNDGASIEVSYLTGPEYIEVVETIRLT